MSFVSPRTGVWLIGARGSVATTAITGALAIRAGLAGTDGCVTELPALARPWLPPIPSLVFGGHDITDTPLPKKAEELGAAGVLPAHLAAALCAELSAVDGSVLPLPESVDGIARDIVHFRESNGLDRVVVINVASTEPVPSQDLETADLDALPPSSRAAYAAFLAGASFVDFTPSTGARLSMLDAMARSRGVPYGGNDGKTGETLVKSVLAPMFASRNLRVRSWSGLNLLGGGDGARLADPAANAAKTASKQRVLADTLGYEPQGTTRIDYVETLGDFKAAWDLISFTGFLGTGMRMEFTWHGCDSALAAPLILDLARLTAAAHAAGRTGALPELAFFFKDPIGDAPGALADQWSRLVTFVEDLSTSLPGTAGTPPAASALPPASAAGFGGSAASPAGASPAVGPTSPVPAPDTADPAAPDHGDTTRHVDAARVDAAHVDGAHVDGAHVDGGRVDGARVDGGRVDGARVDGARLDAARVDGGHVDGGRVDGGRVDAAGVDGGQHVDASRHGGDDAGGGRHAGGVA
ncbi:myo-inositol-1-phosphate synthase [Catenuloplanes nepalensis]|uniref:Myo-inositol-1-phosphate synthase n=1 Tax=Catenuloplanes nepalensis TaxID=587533 RepID=A0ABT9MTF5_9ACTN|nr:myo-inositol-1-phosphate synthase [Catenuloplanes nepalensis]